MTELETIFSTPSLDRDIRTVAARLRGDLVLALNHVGGISVRPSRLIERLKLDKTMAGRLLRALRSEEAYELLFNLPAPAGLRIFLKAAVRAGIEAPLRDRLADSIDQYESLIHELPDRRASIDAAISRNVPEARQRSERSARQAVYKAMSYLVGLRCDTLLTASILQPSIDGSLIDAVGIWGRFGLNRLRSTAPVNVLAFTLDGTAAEPSGQKPRVETLDGDIAQEDPRRFLLTDFCSRPLPDLQIAREGDYIGLSLSPNAPPLNMPVTLVTARVQRNCWRRSRDGELTHEWAETWLRFPCRSIVKDVYLRDDVYVDVPPELTTRLPTHQTGPLHRHGLKAELNSIDLHTTVEQLGVGLEGIAVRDVPRYPELMRHVFQTIGWDSARFRAYRFHMIYPVPMVSYTWWFRLPQRAVSG